MKRLFKPPGFLRWYFHRRTWAINSKKVFLTFDDGPNDELTEEILSVLNEYNVKATFFCVGSNAKKHPELMMKIVGQGHTVGNHTMEHQRSGNISNKKYREAIQRASEHIDSHLFRPPYGRLKSIQAHRISKEYKIIMWSWLSYDFDEQVPLDKILNNAEKQIKAGDIIVLHDNTKVKHRVLHLLPELIKIIRGKGLEFEVISA